MSCQVYEEMLSAYIDGELSAQDKEALEAHLAACGSCRSALSELRAVKAALASVPEEEVPPGLHEMIMCSAIIEKRGFFARLSERLSKWTARQWIPAVAAAMVLVMFLSAGGGVWFANRKLGLDLAGKPLSSGVKEDEGLLKAKGTDGLASSRSGVPTAPPEYSGGGVGPAAAPPGMGEAGVSGVKTMMTADSASPATVQLDADKKIIKRAQLGLEVSRGKVPETSELAMNAVKANFGYIESSSISQAQQGDREYTNFYMVARVPAENLDPTVDAIMDLGRTVRQDTNAQDVTDQYVDLDARLRNKENQEQRLLTIMGEAKSVGELLQVEGELSRVRGEIESMKAQIQYYDKSVAMSTVSLTLTEEGAIKPPSDSPWRDVWEAFVRAWRNLLLFVAKAAPGLIVLGALFGVTMFVLRRKRA
ncbi:MAG: DUF4349 domain-containing protein [Bacillota bacterium]